MAPVTRRTARTRSRSLAGWFILTAFVSLSGPQSLASEADAPTPADAHLIASATEIVDAATPPTPKPSRPVRRGGTGSATPVVSPQVKPKRPRPESADPAAKPQPSPWTFSGQARLSLDYDETVQPRVGKGDPEPDTYWAAVPTLNLRYRSGPTQAQAGYTFRALGYSQNEDRDSLSHLGRLTLDHSVTDIWKVSLRESFSYLEDTGGEQNDTITNPTTYTFNSVQLQNSLQWPETVRWALTLGNDFRDYDSPRQNDYRSYDIGLNTDVDHTDNLSSLYEYRFRRIDVQGSDCEPVHRVTTGLGYKISGTLQARASLGILHFPNLSAEELAAQVSLTKRIDPVSLTAGWNRDAYVSTSQSYITRRDIASLSASWGFTESWSLGASAHYIFDKSVATDKVDTQRIQTNLSLGYNILQSLKAEIAWGYRNQEARGTTDRDIDGHRIGVAAVYSF